MDSGRNRAQRLMALLQLCDSALPVGTFTFSGGLETAVAAGCVCDVVSLERYVRALMRQSLYVDGIVALHAHRAAVRRDFSGVAEADRFLWASKPAAEARQMAQRMGQKLVDLCRRFFPSALLTRFSDEVAAGRLPGCYPVGQAVVFASVDLDEKALFCALRYGQLSMLLSAALRLMRLSHFETQQLLARLAGEADADYQSVITLDLEDVATFAPLLEVRAAQHELGAARLFSN
jgi:urease accessory protein